MASVALSKFATSRDVQENAACWLTRQGYSYLAPGGLLSSAFRDTFVPSAFHQDIVTIARDGLSRTDKGQCAGWEWVYRHVDETKVGISPFHLSSFKMLVFFIAESWSSDDVRLRKRIIETFVGLLNNLGLAHTRCMVSYFGGGNIRGQHLPPDGDFVRLLAETGHPRQRIVPIEGAINFTNVMRIGEPAGPRAEVFWQTPGGDIMELATLAFERYIVSSQNGRLTQSKALVYGGALGIERLAAALENTDVFGVPGINALIRLAEEETHPRTQGTDPLNLRKLGDAVRTLCVLVALTGASHRGRRGARLRRLGRRICEFIDMLGIRRAGELLERMVGSVFENEALTQQNLVAGRAETFQHILRLTALRPIRIPPTRK